MIKKSLALSIAILMMISCTVIVMGDQVAFADNGIARSDSDRILERYGFRPPPIGEDLREGEVFAPKKWGGRYGLTETAERQIIGDTGGDDSSLGFQDDAADDNEFGGTGVDMLPPPKTGGPIVSDSLWSFRSSRHDLSLLPDAFFEHVAVSTENPNSNDTSYGGHEGYLYDTATERWILVRGFISRGTGHVIQIGNDPQVVIPGQDGRGPFNLSPFTDYAQGPWSVSGRHDLMGDLTGRYIGIRTDLTGTLITPPVIGILGFPDQSIFNLKLSLPAVINFNGVVSIAEIIPVIGLFNGIEVIYYEVFDFATGTLIFRPLRLDERFIFDPNSLGPLHIIFDPFDVEKNVLDRAEDERYPRVGDPFEAVPGSEIAFKIWLQNGKPSDISLEFRSNVNRPPSQPADNSATTFTLSTPASF